MLTPYDHVAEVIAAYVALLGAAVAGFRVAWRRISPFVSRRWARLRLKGLSADLLTIQDSFRHPRFAITQGVQAIALLSCGLCLICVGVVDAVSFMILFESVGVKGFQHTYYAANFLCVFLPFFFAWWMCISAGFRLNLMSDPVKTMKRSLSLVSRVRQRWPDLQNESAALISGLEGTVKLINQATGLPLSGSPQVAPLETYQSQGVTSKRSPTADG